MMRTQGVRHTGSAVLDLCNVACRRVDALWEFGLRPWDVAAGTLIVAEAGGRGNQPGRLGAGPQGTQDPREQRLHRTMRETIVEAWP
jgi:fructose-1,6-bisphosphatase/inositol monophosphatase family enzyme